MLRFKELVENRVKFVAKGNGYHEVYLDGKHQPHLQVSLDTSVSMGGGRNTTRRNYVLSNKSKNKVVTDGSLNQIKAKLHRVLEKRDLKEYYDDVLKEMVHEKEFILEEKKSKLYHGTYDSSIQIRPGMHLGTKEQAHNRMMDRTEFNSNEGHMHHIEHDFDKSKAIEIEDHGSPSLSQALHTAASKGRMDANRARIASKKSDEYKAKALIHAGIHHVYYQNKFEGSGTSHIVVDPSKYNVVKTEKWKRK
jgi:membrane carboxypeptidase/penicillin-binding protein